MAATNKSLLRYDGTMGVNEMGQPVQIATRDSWAAQEADRLERHRRSMAAHNRLVNVGKVASIAPLAFAAPAVLGGGAAASAVPAAATTAGTAGAGMTLGNIFNLANLGVGAFSAFMGNRAQNRGLDKQIALQREQFAMQHAAENEARAEAKRQFDAQQANTARQFAADDADRAFSRGLLEQREARLAPYRAQADLARRRLAAFLGMR